MKFRKKIAGAFVALGMTAALLSAGVAYAEEAESFEIPESVSAAVIQAADGIENNMETLGGGPVRATVYRLYNPYVPGGDHHYTTDKAEHDNLIKAGWTDESGKVNAYDVYKYVKGGETPVGTVPVYREYNPYAASGTHNWTTDKTEHDSLVKAGWRDEGIAWYSTTKNSGDFRNPVFRLYNPYTGEHFYCKSMSEYIDVIKAGWNGESEKNVPFTTDPNKAQASKPCWYGLAEPEDCGIGRIAGKWVSTAEGFGDNVEHALKNLDSGYDGAYDMTINKDGTFREVFMGDDDDYYEDTLVGADPDVWVYGTLGTDFMMYTPEKDMLTDVFWTSDGKHVYVTTYQRVRK